MKKFLFLAPVLLTHLSFAQLFIESDFDFVGKTLNIKTGEQDKFKLHCMERDLDNKCQKIEIIQIDISNTGIDSENELITEFVPTGIIFSSKKEDIDLLKDQFKDSLREEKKEFLLPGQLTTGYVAIAAIGNHSNLEKTLLLTLTPVAIAADLAISPITLLARINIIQKNKFKRFIKSGFKNKSGKIRVNYNVFHALQKLSQP